MCLGGALGAYAEERLIAADGLVKIPDGVDDVTAAAIILKGMTTQILIHKAFKVTSWTCVSLSTSASVKCMSMEFAVAAYFVFLGAYMVSTCISFL